MKKIVFTFLVPLLFASISVSAQRNNLLILNHSGSAGLGGCSYFITPVAVKGTCRPVAVTALRRSVSMLSSYNFDRTALVAALGPGYYYIGGIVEGTNGSLYVYSCSRLCVLQRKDATGDCGGDVLEVIYNDESNGRGILDIFDRQ